jgi:hypothetical protein
LPKFCPNFFFSNIPISRYKNHNIDGFRFSKKEVAKILSENDEDKAASADLSGDQTPTKPFERKNSFLGKIFGGSSKKKGQASAGRPVLATFSAQFPPPELSEVDAHATYQALKKAAQSIYNSPPPPLVPAPDLQKLGLDDEATYDRPQNGTDNFPIYSKVSHNRKKENGSHGIILPELPPAPSVYNVGSPLSVYGFSMSGTGDCVYSYPPPPLPYRPVNWNSNGPNSLQVIQFTSMCTCSQVHVLMASRHNKEGTYENMIMNTYFESHFRISRDLQKKLPPKILERSNDP